MREMGIKAQWIKKSTKTTVDSCFDTNLRNVLKREFSPERPNAVWCSDITYISTRLSGFVYLTSIMDLYSRKIIAWTLSKTLEVEEVLKCLEKARSIRNLDDPIVIHTDRGIHYTCGLYREMTQGMMRSYSKKGTPYDNACIESFHSLIKREWLNRFEIENYRQAYRLVWEYIEGWYNPKRIHSHCGYESPNDHEIAWHMKNKRSS